MIMDEPTNHIDSQTKWVFERWIQDYDWIVCVISHDRAFLQKFASKIIEITPDWANVYDGNYDDYVLQKKQGDDAQLRQYDAYVARKKQIEEMIKRIRLRASATSDPSVWKLLRNKLKYYEREILDKPTNKPKLAAEYQLDFAGWSHEWKIIISTDEYEIRGKDRILVTWENGAWKTTLLKSIYENLCTNNKSVLYFDQHNSSVNSPKYLRDRAYDVRWWFSWLWVLKAYGFSDKYWHIPVNDLSYWQKVRLRFVQLMKQNVDILLLDEPTNHLDIPSREAVEDAITTYPWAVVLVTHDQYYVDKYVCTQVRRMQKDRSILIEKYV